MPFAGGVLTGIDEASGCEHGAERAGFPLGHAGVFGFGGVVLGGEPACEAGGFVDDVLGEARPVVFGVALRVDGPEVIHGQAGFASAVDDVGEFRADVHGVVVAADDLPEGAVRADLRLLVVGHADAGGFGPCGTHVPVVVLCDEVGFARVVLQLAAGFGGGIIAEVEAVGHHRLGFDDEIGEFVLIVVPQVVKVLVERFTLRRIEVVQRQAVAVHWLRPPACRSWRWRSWREVRRWRSACAAVSRRPGGR